MVATVAAGTSAQYYLSQTEYYLAGREPPGKWLTAGPGLGITAGGPVETHDFERLHAARDKRGVLLLTNTGGKLHVGGYDITFSAPKSVSVLWGLSDADLRQAISRAQEGAVAAAISMLDRDATFCRRGKGGRTREAVRLTVALFQHGEARPAEHEDGLIFADVALHHHACVLSLAQRADGTYGAIDGKALFAWKMAAGAVYHCELARSLQQLGFSIEVTGANGLFEISGVDQDLCRYFSARRAEIEERLSELGIERTGDAPALAAIKARVTRRAKTKADGASEDRHRHWRERAGARGFAPERLAESALAAAEGVVLTPEAADALIRARVKAVPGILTETQSLFEHRHLVAAVAAALVGTGAGAERARAEVERLVSEGEVVALGCDARWPHPIYSTREMIAIERQLRDFARDLASHQVADIPDRARVAQLIREMGLNGEQAEAAYQATTALAIGVTEGAPGVGKTTLLTPVTKAWTEAGWRVIGTATAWKVANALRDGLQIEARAVDSWLAGVEHGQPFLTDRTLLVVDEAGLLSSRQLHRVLTEIQRARASSLQVAVRLVGDRKQLQAIGGPGLRIVADVIGAQRVDTIVRQRAAWARKVVSLFGSGQAEAALGSLEARGAVQQCATSQATARAIITAWREARAVRADAPSPLLIAKSNAQVLKLNALVREALRAEGLLAREDGAIIPAVTASGREHRLSLAVGDRLRFLMRADAIGVINGTEATLTGIGMTTDGTGSGVRLTARIGKREVSFEAKDIADQRGRLRLGHAYATTIYGAQGQTTETALVWVDTAMNRHDAFVAASRARGRTRLFVDRQSVDARVRSDRALNDRARPIDQEERRVALARALSRSGEKASTLDISDESPILDAPRGRQSAKKMSVAGAESNLTRIRVRKRRRQSELER